MSISPINDIKKIRYLYYGFVLIVLVRFYDLNLLLHQFESPVLNFPDADNTFWFILYTGIPQFLVKNFTISLLFDLSLFIVPVLCLIFNRTRIFPVLFSIIFFLYFITVSNFQAHHAHNLNGILMLSILFYCTPKTFASVLYFFRYYVLFVMVSAALWKIFRGSVFHLDHMSNTFLLQHLYVLTDHPSSTYSTVIKYLMDHPILSHLIFIMGTLLEFVFLIGFFTKKYDKLLIILFCCFFIGDYAINQLPFFEFYIFLIPLLHWKEINEFYNANNKLLIA